MNQKDIEQDKINLLFNIDRQFNGLTDSDIKKVLHYVFRYRKQEYIDNNFKKKLNNLDLHFSIQIFDNKNGYISLIDSSILNTMGKKFFDALNLYTNSTNQNLWIDEKKSYEAFKKKSYFIENDYLASQNILELIFLRGILKLDKFQKLKSESIRKGLFKEFYQEISDLTQKTMKRKDCFNELIQKESFISDEFCYHFKEFFSKQSSVNPYYSYKISDSDNEITFKYVGDLKGQIRTQLTEYAGKNKLKLQLNDKEVSSMIFEFQNKFENDSNNYCIIVNKYVVTRLWEELSKTAKSNIDMLPQEIIKLEENFSSFIDKLSLEHPESLNIIKVREYLHENKEKTFLNFKNYVAKKYGVSNDKISSFKNN